MNSDIQGELTLLMNIYDVKANEQIKILSICSKVLTNEEYIKSVKDLLNDVMKNEDFIFIIEFFRVISSLIHLNKNVSFYKEISEDRMRFVLYAVLFDYLLKNQANLINKLPIGQLRLLYCNAMDLVLMQPEFIKIAKKSVLSCISWLGGPTINI